jgi:hypothetical protein
MWNINNWIGVPTTKRKITRKEEQKIKKAVKNNTEK